MSVITSETIDTVKRLYHKERFTIARIVKAVSISRYYVEKILTDQEVPLNGEQLPRGWSVHYEKVDKLWPKRTNNPKEGNKNPIPREDPVPEKDDSPAVDNVSTPASINSSSSELVVAIQPLLLHISSPETPIRYVKSRKWISSRIIKRDFGGDITDLKCYFCDRKVFYNQRRCLRIIEEGKTPFEQTHLTCKSCYRRLCPPSDRVGRERADPSPRNAIPDKMREDVWMFYEGEFESGLCYICTRSLDIDDFHLAHLVSHRNGGPITIENLRPTHAKCNCSLGPDDLIPMLEYHGLNSSYLQEFYPQSHALMNTLTPDRDCSPHEECQSVLNRPGPS